MDLKKLQPRPKAVRYLANYLALFLGSIMTKLKVSGRHHIPRRGPFIVACNHFSILDPALVLYGIQRPVNFLMATDQIVDPLFIWAPWLYGYIPTDRRQLAPSTIKQALKALERKEVVGIFPEGYSQSTVLRPAKRGAIYLAQTMAVPILPVAIQGAESLWDNWLRGNRPSLRVRIGRPYRLPPYLPGRDRRQDWLRRQGDDLMVRIAALLPESYHGLYRGHPQITVYRSENRLALPSDSG
ncbi:MAG: 1-acyl-sn-glycerol-3-phosphate acyltransferase [Candidatus Neomarinimicrobiota bacterium]|nr:MAG: 1-acyl-sn-glycerol-3-phosphate acyltransferase [Candidatus Neomarinimicrobiota bacterium]